MSIEAIPGATLLDLTHHLKSLNLLRPLIALEQNKGRIDASADLCEGVDVQYLCLEALDVMMENTTVGSGATVHEVLARVQAMAERMKKTLSSAQAQVIARYVLDGLTNAREKFSAFTASYYHAPTDTMQVHQYRLVHLAQDIDDVLRYSLTDEGFLVYMGMLNLPPDVYVELMEKALEILLRRGKFEDALNVAKQARISALSFSQQIRAKLKAAEAAPGSVRWPEVNASLQQARAHVAERQREDLRLEEQVRDALRIAEEVPCRISLAQILVTIKGASGLRTRLVQDISGAGERYRAASQAVFTARRFSSLPGLQDTLLPRAMALSVDFLSENADLIVSALFTPVHPLVPSLAAVVDLLNAEKAAPVAPMKDDGVVVPYVEPPPQFSESLVQEVQEWLRVQFLEGDTTLSALMAEARAQGRSREWRRCLVFQAMHSFAPTETVFRDVLTVALDDFESDISVGSDIHFACPTR